MDKPYLLRPWEIERLTDRQIIELYYRARNDKGVPVTIPDEQHEWTQRRKQISTQDLLLNKFDNFMKMGAMIGASRNQMIESWKQKYGEVPRK